MDRLRLVSLDTSQIVRLTKDAASSVRDRRRASQKAGRLLSTNGTTLFLTHHHVEELLLHENENVRLERLRWLGTLDFVATLDGADGVPGSIVTALGHEARVATTSPLAGPVRLRDEVRKTAIILLPGEVIRGRLEPIQMDLHRAFMESAARTREHVAIVEGKLPKVDECSLRELSSRPFRDRSEATRLLHAMEAVLTKDIIERGDKRIPNPSGTSRWFFDRVGKEGVRLHDQLGGMFAHLKSLGITVDEDNMNRSLNDLLRKHEFRSKILVGCRALGMARSDVGSTFDMERIPTWLVEDAIVRHGQKRARHPGSDINDRNLVCVGMYSDTCFVDRRTFEDVRRAREKAPIVDDLLPDVRRTGGDFYQAFERLAA